MNLPLISVIIPVYKVAEYLPRCFDCLLNQTYTNLEFIFVNDGTPDNSEEIIRTFSKTDKRVRLINQRNQGVSGARNTGLRAANGELVAFIDPDDLIHPKYFELLLNCMLSTNADVVFCEHAKFYDFEGFKIEKIDENIDPKELTYNDAFSIWTVRHCVWGRLYKKEDVEGHEFSKIRLGDDTIFNLDVLCHIKGAKLYYINLPLYYWYIRKDSFSHTADISRVSDQVDWYMNHIDYEEITGAECYLLIHIIRIALAVRYYLTLERKERSKINQQLKYLVKLLHKSKYAPSRDKFLLTILYCFPGAYRLFRIVDDPTMLHAEWESMKKRYSIHEE